MISRSKIQLIASLKQKKYRNLHKNFIAEGFKTISDLIENGLECQLVLCANDYEILTSVSFDNLIETIDRKGFDKLRTQVNPAGILAVFKMPEWKINQAVFKSKITLILDKINDPGNLGTIIRIADWYGIENIICSKDTVDCYNPKVVNSSMASIGRVKIFYTDLVSVVQKSDIPAFACVINGNPVYQFAQTKEAFIAIGNESNGISSEIQELCQHQISIPKIGKAESLNAAIACGIICDVFCAKR